MISIKSNLQSYGINLPTSLSEVSKEYFDKLLANVKLQEHYCIVALCYRDKVFNIVSALRNNNKNAASEIIPLIAKIADENVCGYKQMERAELDRTSIERAIHLPVKANVCGLTNFAAYIKDDTDLIKALIDNTYFQSKLITDMNVAPSRNLSPYAYFIEFKIVPIRDIVATRDLSTPSICIYKDVKSSAN